MLTEVIIIDKNIEAAIKKGAKELGVDVAKVAHEVIEAPKKGFLGIGGAPAKVKVYFEKQPIDFAVDFVKKLLSNMDIEATVTVTEDKKGSLINVEGEQSGALIGHHGETLDQLQYLVNLAANRGGEDDFCKIAVDVEGYRAKREQTLRALATRMAARVLKYKRNYTFEPMSAYERRLIHSAVQEIEGVVTYSVGSESSRRVVIALDGARDGSGEPRRRKSGPHGSKKSKQTEEKEEKELSPFAHKFLES